jgi:hypothetical protein
LAPVETLSQRHAVVAHNKTLLALLRWVRNP